MKKVWKNISLILCVLMVLTLFVGCSNGKVEEVKVTGKVTISGLDDMDKNINLEEILGLKAVTRNMKSIKSSGEVVESKVKGVFLDDFLKKHNVSQKDLDGIRFTSGDGYSVEIPKDILMKKEIILAYEIDGKPLDEKSRPLRVAIDGERSMYWLKNLSKIELILGEEETEVRKIVFLDTVVKSLPQEDYVYYENKDKAIKIKDLIEKYPSKVEADRICMKAADGLVKNESKDIFDKQYIKINGKNAPMFIGSELQKGMYIKDLMYFNYGENSFFYFNKGLEVLNKKTVDNKQGILLKDIMKEVKFSKGENYKLVAEDGYEVKMSSVDIEKGILYEKDGSLRIKFEGLPKNTTVKKLAYIEITTEKDKEEVEKEAKDDTQKDAPKATKSESKAVETKKEETKPEEKPSWQITVVDCNGKSTNITNLDIEKMNKVTISALKKKKDGSEINEKWTGVLLKDVLSCLGITDYSSVSVEAKDGYAFDMDKKTVELSDTILGLSLDGKSITNDDKYKPTQLVVGSQRSNAWVKNVYKIKVAK